LELVKGGNCLVVGETEFCADGDKAGVKVGRYGGSENAENIRRKKKEEQKRTSDHTGRAKIWATWVGGWTLRRGEGEEWKKSREETN